MAELLSVGLDVGTTTTQLILSHMEVRNNASAFAVPELEITERQVIYRSPVHFTPLLRGELVDGEGIRRIVTQEYRSAGIERGEVDTGAIIITGETSRKENAAAVLESLSSFAGDFVVATAGPDLESVLAAKGAGAVAYSEKTGKRVLHMDIGGGTSNLALMEEGSIVATACLKVGGRLLKFDEAGRITYRSPVLAGLTELGVGDMPEEADVLALCRKLAAVLEMAAGLREKDESFSTLTTFGTKPLQLTGEAVISFSGGVADCIQKDYPPLAFGDIGPELGRAIRGSLLCKGAYILGAETIRATVIGAGCYSTTLSGSTVFYRGVQFPIKNLPVVAFSPEKVTEETVVFSIADGENFSYAQIKQLAAALAKKTQGAIYVALQTDAAKALGHALCLLLPQDRPICCIDRVKLTEGDFLDIGAPIGPALPVVIKTLILSR